MSKFCRSKQIVCKSLLIPSLVFFNKYCIQTENIQYFYSIFSHGAVKKMLRVIGGLFHRALTLTAKNGLL